MCDVFPAGKGWNASLIVTLRHTRHRQEGAESDGSREDFPSVYDGARGVHFIEKTVESDRSTEKWTHASWRSSRRQCETV